MGGTRYCCVVGCKNSQSRNRELTFYSFPRRNWEIKKRNEWIKAVRRITLDNKPWQPNKNTRICSAHFVGGKQSSIENSPAYVPTIFPPNYKKKVISKSSIARHERILKIKERKDTSKVSKPQETESFASDIEIGLYETPNEAGSTSIACQTDACGYKEESEKGNTFWSWNNDRNEASTQTNIYIDGEINTNRKKMTSTDTYQLKWHSHSSHLNGSVAALLRSERFTDVVLCTMDGSQIPAHKFILSSCSVYLSSLFEGQRSVTRMGGMLYVVLPSEISTKALKILVEYMYKGETTVSNEVLDTVLKAGEVLKIRGLWRQADDGVDSAPAEKSPTPAAAAVSVNKQVVAKKPDEQPKIAVKKDDKLLKTFNPIQPQGVNRPMFIGPPKLVFIKTSEGGAQATIRPGGPKGQTILVAPAPAADTPCPAPAQASPTVTAASTTIADDSSDDTPPPRILRRHAAERKYGKRKKADSNTENDNKDEDLDSTVSKKPSQCTIETEVQIKDEPEWDASSIEEEERSIAEMFQAEMSVKSEPIEDLDIEEESLIYSPLACELCAEVFTVPAAWVRHVQGHARADHHHHSHARKRKHRSDSDDTEETMALLRCDLCQKHFPNPAEWVRHIQSTHTETELAISNNSAPPTRHNRFTEGAQNKTCAHCKKTFPSHASMLIHMRTHTGERPFVCGLCNKGFNVKSNLLRHLRTLHDQLISPAQVEDEEEVGADDRPGPSHVKRES